MYHHVSPNPGLVTVSPKVFRRQMAHLAKAGYRTLTADAFLACILGAQPVPRKGVLITFDDGYLDNYVHAYPVLKRYGLRATIFLVTSWIHDGPARGHADSDTSLPETPNHHACRRAIAEGNADDVMLRWSEVEAMQGTVEVHSHTHTHTRWHELYPTTSRRLELLQQDLVKSRTVLQERIGSPSRHLCWPWGYVAEGYPRVAVAAGFRAQYLTQKGINTVGTKPAEIGRVVIKDRADSWFSSRVWLYRKPRLGRLYLWLRGD
jgi:peptidoglycan/xylan/chitin deacetylase (PgdA/CDA1 family)